MRALDTFGLVALRLDSELRSMSEKQYQSIEDYRSVADALYAVSEMVLFSFAKHDCDTKNIIIRNFVARSAMTLKSIFSL